MGIDMKEFILTYISFITPSKKIYDYVEKCLDSNQWELSLNVCDRFSKNIGFKNNKNQHLYINVSFDKIYVYNENDSGYEDFSFFKDDNIITIDFNSVIKDISGEVETVKCTEEFGKYSTWGFMLSHRTIVSKYTRINGEAATRLMCSNYDKYIDDYVIDGKLVRCVDLKYHYLSDMNSKNYYVSNYRPDMLLNEKSDVSPDFSLYKGNLYELEEKIDLYNKNDVKSNKNML